MSADGERIAQLEAKVEAVHQDLHMIGDTFNRLWEAIDALRKELIGRPSWAVTFALTIMSSLLVASLAAVIGIAIAR